MRGLRAHDGSREGAQDPAAPPGGRAAATGDEGAARPVSHEGAADRSPARERPVSSSPGGPRRTWALRYLAGVLSAVFPGLGQLVTGRRLLALVFALPVLAALGLLAAYVGTTGRLTLLAELASPSTLAQLLLLQAMLLVWRVASVVAALLDRRWPSLGPRDALPVLLVCAFAILPQAYAGYVTNTARETAAAIFRRPPAPAAPTPTLGPSIAPDSGAPSAGSAAPTPSAAPGTRLTVLLIGMDSGPGRDTALTDTLIEASFDPAGRSVSMVSVPRDMVDVPLPDGQVFQPKINSLLTYARLYPSTYPSPGGDPHRLLEAALDALLGVHIDYYAQVNLPGFVGLVDAVGGVDINVPHGICDPGYHDFGLNGFLITAGPHHLNGAQALGYARVRKAYGESDFTRAARQQEVIIALKDAVQRGGFLHDPLAFLAALRQTVETDLPPDLLPTFVSQVDTLDASTIYRAVIQPPLVHSSAVPDPRGSIQLPDLAAIRLLGQHLFPPPGVQPDPAYVTSRAGSSSASSPVPPPSVAPGGASATAGPGDRSATPVPGLPADDTAIGRAPICPAPATATPAPRTTPPTTTPSPSPAPAASAVPVVSPSASASPAAASPHPTLSPSPSAPTASPSPSPLPTMPTPAGDGTPVPAGG